MKPKVMKHIEKCLDCEDVINNDDFDGGGSPMEMYVEEGYHVCNVKKPRVVVTND